MGCKFLDHSILLPLGHVFSRGDLFPIVITAKNLLFRRVFLKRLNGNIKSFELGGRRIPMPKRIRYTRACTRQGGIKSVTLGTKIGDLVQFQALHFVILFLLQLSSDLTTGNAWLGSPGARELGKGKSTTQQEAKINISTGGPSYNSDSHTGMRVLQILEILNKTEDEMCEGEEYLHMMNTYFIGF